MNVGVIGIGKLGKIHARIYNELPQCTLKGICDVDREQTEGLEYLKDVPF